MLRGVSQDGTRNVLQDILRNASLTVPYLLDRDANDWQWRLYRELHCEDEGGNSR
jgi:hypothetical protein